MRILGGSVVVVLLLSLIGCGDSDDPAEPSATAVTEEQPAFDPMAYEEPSIPEVREGRLTRADATTAAEYFAAAYTYAARTGFVQEFATFGADVPLVIEANGLASDGLHAVMDDATVEVAAVGRPYQATPKSPWTIPVRMVLTIPDQQIADESGKEVRTEPVRTLRVEAVLVAVTGLARHWYEWGRWTEA